MILKAGLTGGIASGKSTILRNFETLGCVTVDADAIVARLYRPGQPGHEALVRTYGDAILLANGEIDRPGLAAVAFSSPEAARRLNELIHPLVIEEEAQALREAAAGSEDLIFMVEATLLLEAGGKQRYDRIVVVDVAPDVQIARAIARGMPEEEVRRRIAHQLPREDRLRQADYVIDNSGDLTAGYAETRRVHARLQEDLARMKKGRAEARPGPANH